MFGILPKRITHESSSSFDLWYQISLSLMFKLKLLTTNLCSQNTSTGPSIGTPKNLNFHHRASIISVATLSETCSFNILSGFYPPSSHSASTPAVTSHPRVYGACLTHAILYYVHGARLSRVIH